MDEGNSSKERVKTLSTELRVERLLTVQKDEQLQFVNQKIDPTGAKAIQAFQLSDKYNVILFSWYFKGFELLRRYLTKQNPVVDLENLDFEAVDKEMEVDEAAEGLRLLPQLLKAMHPRLTTRPLSLWLETIPQLHDIFT